MNGLIQAENDTVQTLASNTDDVKFNKITLRTASANCFNGWLGYNQGEAQFNIVVGGVYEITFNANVTSATVGNVGLALFADGVKLSGTEMNAVVSTANAYENVAMNRKIRVCARGNTTLTIRSVPTIVVAGSPVATQIPSIKNANISIERLA